jgi:predicted urease superfamily metal-dependent hydrolase
MSLSANDANDRVEQLVALTERLTDRLSAELVLFEKRKPHETAETLPETANLANIYRREAARVKADPSLITGASPATMKKLRAATVKFNTVLERHTTVLEAAKTLTEGLVRAIATEIQRQRTPVSTYGSNARSNVSDAKAVTLNRRA